MIFFMNKRILIGVIVLLSAFRLFSQNDYPKIDIKIQTQEEYSRSPRLEEEDLYNNTTTGILPGT